ncbi:MAG: PD40 domain-containing protein [Anaerolineae bacterium]|nr:PD40 domain-containing protein [Anaerolineae bacterium]
MKIKHLFLVVVLLSASCSAATAPTPTAVPTATITTTATTAPTETAVAPTETATTTSTATEIPTVTPTTTITPTPYPTAQATVGFIFDNWQLLTVPSDVLSSLSSPMMAFVNQNDKDNVSNGGTPQPATGLETLYYAAPNNPGGRIAVTQLAASTNNQIYISANGHSVAYFKDGRDSTTGQTGGLYMLSLDQRISGRILPITSLVQRGFFSDPVWTRDGSRLAMAVATGYDIDIFTIGSDGANLKNLTNNGSYDIWPSWSPDGSKILFVSDRDTCPSWIPSDANACDPAKTPPPVDGGVVGSIYVLDVDSGETHKLTDEKVSEPPRWLNNTTITFATGDPNLDTPPQRHLWIEDITTAKAQEVKLADGSDGAIRLSEAWSADGSAVVYQSVTNSASEVIAARRDGTLIGRTSELNFPRFGMSASWIPDGSRIALGGVSGQCPYGARVLDSSFNFVTRGNPPPGMCNPSYSPDGAWLAFIGVNPRVDGRVDVLVANPNGTGVANLTGVLKGIINMIGWVGGS